MREGSPRFHGLDSLRAVMMLLGIYLHTVVGYSREGGWPYKDPFPTAIYDWTLGLIHAFRMPLFYVMAGFFAALLYYRRGGRAFISNRTVRILLPFVAFWAFMYPIVCGMAEFARKMDTPGALAQAVDYVISGRFLGFLHPGHLWFLEYLLILYILFLLWVPIVNRIIPLSLRDAFQGLFRAGVASPWRAFLFAAPTFAALCFTRSGELEDPPGFVPVFRILLPYVIVFGFGWVLYGNRDLLADFRRHAWKQSLAPLLIVAVILPFEDWLDRNPIPAKFLIAAAVSIVMWLMIFGLTGLFLRYLNRPSARRRYLSDSSYWLYLVHMIVVMGYQILLRPLSWPAEIKVWLVLGLSVPTMLVTYHFLVRPTVLGLILNGRRYSIERAPKAEAVLESV